MLLRLREDPEVHQRLLFGTDYPLSVFHLPAWGRTGMGTLWDIINTTNRFARQFKMCRSLGVRFQSFEQVVRACTPRRSSVNQANIGRSLPQFQHEVKSLSCDSPQREQSQVVDP